MVGQEATSPLVGHAIGFWESYCFFVFFVSEGFPNSKMDGFEHDGWKGLWWF